MPHAQAYRLCPQGVFLPVNMPRYLEMSKQVFSILSQYSPIMEIVSIDEAFLDISGCSTLFGSPEKIGCLIKEQVYSKLGLTISVGVSYNKFLAKLASDMDKPDGLRIITESQALELLRPLPVWRMWGIGLKTTAAGQNGYKNHCDIQDLPPGWLVNSFHLVVYSGNWLGYDGRAVETEHERSPGPRRNLSSRYNDITTKTNRIRS